jgi:uncharacterized DUF497 family protein
MAVLFECDPIKAESNRRKHGVTFEEATTVFYDPLASTLADDQHSYDETRMITIGLSARNRLLFVVYTETGPVIRLIGARVATAFERKQYEDLN